MAFDTRAPAIYGKGSLDASFYGPVSHNLVYYSNKLQSGNFTSSLNPGAVNAGPGNPMVIQIPDGQNISLEMTAADLHLAALGLNVGKTPRYGGIVEIKEPTAVADGKLRVLGNAVPHLGNNTGIPYAWVNGTAYRVETEGQAKGTLIGFEGKEGAAHCVRYCIIDPSAEQFDIDTLFAPQIVIARIVQPLYGVEGGDLDTGSRIGEDIFTIPRFQFSGNASRAFDQTTAATTSLSGTALSYDEGVQTGLACVTSLTKLAYVVRHLYNKDHYQNVENIFVVGGMMTLPMGNTAQVPLKLLMNNAQSMQPAYGDFTYTIEDDTIASVNETGVVTGETEGTTNILITHKTIDRLVCAARINIIA